MSGQQPPSQPPNRGSWGRMPPSPSPIPFRPASPYAPSPPPIMSARRLPGSPIPPMPMSPMSPMFGCPSPARLPPRMAAPGSPYIPCPRPRWPSPLPPGVPLPPGPRPYRLTPVQSPTPLICPSPEYFYSPYTEAEYIGVPLEPPGPPPEYEDATQAGLSTAAIIASQSQDYVDEKLAEYQATIHQLQVPATAGQ